MIDIARKQQYSRETYMTTFYNYRKALLASFFRETSSIEKIYNSSCTNILNCFSNTLMIVIIIRDRPANVSFAPHRFATTSPRVSLEQSPKFQWILPSISHKLIKENSRPQIIKWRSVLFDFALKNVKKNCHGKRYRLNSTLK